MNDDDYQAEAPQSADDFPRGDRLAVKFETVVLDQGHHRNVDFVECLLVYRGGTVPVLTGCSFFKCQWTLEGAASTTVNTLTTLAALSPELQRMIAGLVLGGVEAARAP